MGQKSIALALRRAGTQVRRRRAAAATSAIDARLRERVPYGPV